MITDGVVGIDYISVALHGLILKEADDLRHQVSYCDDGVAIFRPQYPFGNPLMPKSMTIL